MVEGWPALITSKLAPNDEEWIELIPEAGPCTMKQIRHKIVAVDVAALCSRGERLLPVKRPRPSSFSFFHH